MLESWVIRTSTVCTDDSGTFLVVFLRLPRYHLLSNQDRWLYYESWSEFWRRRLEISDLEEMLVTSCDVREKGRWSQRLSTRREKYMTFPEYSLERWRRLGTVVIHWSKQSYTVLRIQVGDMGRYWCLESWRGFRRTLSPSEMSRRTGTEGVTMPLQFLKCSVHFAYTNAFRYLKVKRPLQMVQVPNRKPDSSKFAQNYSWKVLNTWNKGE